MCAQRRAVLVGSYSLASPQHPERNEDSILVDVDHHVFGIFDGMGGCDDGAVASRLAKRAVQHCFTRYVSSRIPHRSSDRVRAALFRAFNEANHRVLLTGFRKDKELGTTGCVAVISRKRNWQLYAMIGNIGDSRAYHVSGTMCRALTLDDSAASQLRHFSNDQQRDIQTALSSVRRGRELRRRVHGIHLRKLFKLRNLITRMIGAGFLTLPRCYRTDMATGDYLVLTSDGVHDNLTDAEINFICQAGKPQQIAHELVIAAWERAVSRKSLRSKKDDFSAIVIKVL